MAEAFHDGFDAVAGAALAGLDGTLDLFDRMLGQQLQDANELPRPGLGAVLAFQVAAQFGEYGRQLPVPIDVGMVERRWPAAECGQVMQRVEDLLAVPIRTDMPGDDLVASHDLDAVDVALDRHGLKGEGTRHAVGIAVETSGLILVHLGRLADARVERPFGE